MRDVAAAIEANVSSFLLEMGRAGGGIERDDAVRWTLGGSPLGYHNAVVGCAVSDARPVIDAFTSELDRRALPGSWHVTPSMTPPSLWDDLLASGYDDGGEEPAMAVALDDVALVPAEVARDDASLSAYRDVLAAGFGEGPVEADWVTSVWRTIGLDASSWVHVIGRHDGEVVSTATVHLTGDVAGVYFVATHPDARGRGAGTAITRAAMAEARRRGATLAVLGSSPMGQRIYERLGFRTHFTYRLAEREVTP